jgi:hypothetical protein
MSLTRFTNSAVFQAGGLVVILVEVTRKSYLASLVPVIVNAVLNDHQIVTDIVAFVSHGDFPRSRLGEKQRGKILGSWVTRKMRTIAQFSIRDADGGADPQLAEQARMSRVSKTGSIMGSSLRRSTLVPDNDSSTRAPALHEGRELVDDPYEDEEEKHYQELLNNAAFEPTNSLSPQQEPGYSRMAEHSRSLPPVNTSNLSIKSDNPTPVLTPDHGFDFGTDFGHQSPQNGSEFHEAVVPSVAVAPPSTAGSQESRNSYAPLQVRNTDRESLPSRQSQNSIPTGAGGPQSWFSGHSSRPGSAEDWPEEALLYQSHFDGYASHGNRDGPSR